MAQNRRSRLITEGIARSPNRAMLRAVGFGDADDRLLEIVVAETDGAQHRAIRRARDALGDQAGAAILAHEGTSI